MSAIRKSQEWEINSVTVMRKKIKLTEVCKELTSSNNKDNDAVTAMWACFTEVTDTLDKAVCFSQSQALL